MHMLYHQRKIILLLLLCGLAAEAASAQNQVRMEYDAAGNVVKAHPSMKLERATIDGRFSIKVYPSPTKGPLNIRVYDELTGQVVPFQIQLRVTNVEGNRASVIDRTFPNGYISINLSSAPDGIYGLSFLIQKPQGRISNNSIKIVKKS